MIDPNEITTKRVGELPPADFNLTDNLPHEIGTDLTRGTVQQLADLIGGYLGTTDSLAFNPTTVVDGGTLPATTSNEWMLVGKGTFHNVGGQPDIITTEELNALTSNGSYWSLAVEIPINVELAGITQNIRSGYTQTTPSEDAVYNRFAEIIGLISGTQTTDNIINNSTVPGATASDALDTLNSEKEDKQDFIVYADDYANLTDAINAVPVGGKLILGNGTYTGKLSITKDNFSIEGAEMPTYDSLTDKLTGGSIINGYFIVDGSNVSLRNLGVDSGTAQCVALNSGAPMEGLVMHDVAAANINTNNRAENVIAIVKANTTMHAVLLEGLSNSNFNNVHGKGGDFGVVLKVSDSNASNIFGYESRTTNIYIKSDSYAPCNRSNFNNLYSLSDVVTASQPVAVHASTSNMFGINVNNVNILGGTRQFRLIASPAATPTYVMSNINVSNVVMENGVDVGLDLYGVVYNSAFNNILVRNTVSGQGVFSDFNGRGINFNNIRFDDNSGNALTTAIDIRSYSVLNNIVSIRNTDQTSLGYINLNNFANTSKIGIYVGILRVNNVVVNYDKLTGQGAANYLSKYETAGILKSSLFYDDGSNAGFNAAPYNLGAGWSIFSVQGATGSGFVNQVNNIPAMRSISGASNSSIVELRNLPLNLGANAITRFIIGAAGDLSIVIAPSTSAGTYDILTRNISTGVVEKIASSSLATSGTYTPTISATVNLGSVTNVSMTYYRVGNLINCSFRFLVNPGTPVAGKVSFKSTLPINKTGGSGVTAVGSGIIETPTLRPVLVKFDSASTIQILYDADITAGSSYGAVNFQYLTTE